jgi:hypothetical protein
MAAIASLTTYTYAAGTCTLRLTGQPSPLGQVSDRPVLARSRFHLQLYAEEPVAAIAAPATQARPTPPVLLEINGREPQFSALATLVQRYVQGYLAGSDVTLPPDAALSQGGYTLHPIGLTRHRLLFPPAQGDVPSEATLSMVQMADLADVLAQAGAAVHLVAPGDLPKSQTHRPRLPLWIGSAAAVLVAAVLGGQWLISSPSPVVFAPAPDSVSEPDLETARELAQQEEADEPVTALGDEPPEPPEPEPPGPEPSGEELEDAPQALPAPEANDAIPPAGQPQPSGPASPAPTEAPRTQRSRPLPLEEGPEPPQTNNGNGDAAITAARAPAPVPGSEEWVAALADALSQQWPPTPDLPAPLRYRLTLEADGTVGALRPMTAVSTLYQNSPDLPQIGTVLDNLAPGEAITLEARFLPSGEVEIILGD